jgi:transcriptional regulator with XRE-family HTH domain
MAKALGNRIRELREARDLSLREFARKLGDVSAAHVSDIELGRRFPSDDLLAKMASVLDVPLAELKSYDSRPPVQDLKRIAEADPAFGFALRKLVDKKVSAEEIIELAKKKPDREKPE